MSTFPYLLFLASRQKRPDAPLVEITTQPQGFTVTEGQTGSLSVSSINAVRYEWFKVGGSEVLATGSVLDLGELSLDEAGTYYVEVYNKDGRKVTSDSATVTVNAAPVFFAAGFTQLGDSNTATVGMPDASASFPFPEPFVMSNGGYAKTVWRSIGNTKMSVNIFGYPGETAANFNSGRASQVAPFIKQDLPNQYVLIAFGTNDLGQKTPQETFNDVKILHDWVHTTYPAGTKTIAIGVPNRKDIPGFNDKKNEYNDLLRANFQSGSPFMDLYIDLSTDARVWDANVVNDATKFNQADKDGNSGVHFLQSFCDLLAEDIAPKIIQSGFVANDYDLSGGVSLPAIDVIASMAESITGPVNGVYKNANYNTQGTDWSGYMLMNKKLPAGQDGYFQFEQPYEGRYAILGIRSDKANTAFPSYIHRVHSGGAMNGFDTDTGEAKTQLFQGEIVRVVIKNVSGTRKALMYRSCLGLNNFTFEKDLGTVPNGDIYYNINIRQDGAMANPQVSNNCVDI